MPSFFIIYLFTLLSFDLESISWSRVCQGFNFHRPQFLLLALTPPIPSSTSALRVTPSTGRQGPLGRGRGGFAGLTLYSHNSEQCAHYRVVVQNTFVEWILTLDDFLWMVSGLVTSFWDWVDSVDHTWFAEIYFGFLLFENNANFLF